MSVDSHTSSSTGRPQTRVDQAHHHSGRASVTAAVPQTATVDAAVLAAVAGYESGYLSDQLERHAQDLGSRLQSQQFELDRREADFNARVAQLENELRTSRLIQIEREIELREREESFQQKWNDLQQRATDVSAAELALKAEHQEERLVQQANTEQVRQSVQRWQRRLQELDESERQLQAQLADLATERERLELERQDLLRQREQQHSQLITECQSAKTKLAERMSKLQGRSEQLERRQMAVAQLHGDVLRMYREATELRICSEELWGEIAKSMSPASLTQRLAELRRKLADQFELATRTLEDQKHELRVLVDRLAQYRTEIQDQRRDVQRWVRGQREEIERHAAQLVAREQELDRQQAEIQHLRGHWEQRRHAYEQEIRRLRRRLEGSDASHSTLRESVIS